MSKPRKPTEAVVAALGSRAKVRRFDKGYHMLLRDLDAKTVWSTVADWVKR